MTLADEEIYSVLVVYTWEQLVREAVQCDFQKKGGILSQPVVPLKNFDLKFFFLMFSLHFGLVEAIFF